MGPSQTHEGELTDREELDRNRAEQAGMAATRPSVVIGEVNAGYHAKQEARDLADRRVQELEKKNQERFILDPRRMFRRIWGFESDRVKFRKEAEKDINEYLERLGEGATLSEKLGALKAGDKDFGDEGDDTLKKKYGGELFDHFFKHDQEYIDEAVGEQRKLFEADEEATQAAKRLYTDFISNPAMTDQEFKQRLNSEVRERMGAGAGTDGLVLDNYLEVAKTMRDRADSEEAIATAVAGLKLVKAESRHELRTEVHQTAVDKLVTKYEQSKFGNIVPPSVVAAGASIGIWAATRGANTVGRALGLVGGGAVIGATTAVKENALIRQQRAQRERETARGKNYDRDKTKRGEKLKEFEYERFKASDLVEDLAFHTERARGGDGNVDDLINSLAEIKAIKDISAEKKVDLMSYSDPAKVLEERNALIMAQAEARAAVLGAKGEGYDLTAELQSRANTARDQRQEEINVKDQAFAKWRRWEAGKKGLFAGAMSIGVMLAAEEAWAAIDPNKAGLLERAWSGGNNAGATGTALNSFTGGVESQTITDSLTPEQIAELQAKGATVLDKSYTTYTESETRSSVANIFKMAGGRKMGSVHLMDNKTSALYDFDELRGQLSVDASGNLTPWMNSMGVSFNSTESIDMRDMMHNVFDIAVKDLNGGFLHRVVQFGEAIPDDLRNLFDAKGNYLGDGYIAWGKLVGDHLDVAASMKGSGVVSEIVTKIKDEVLHPEFEIIGPKGGSLPPVWFGKRERLGVAEKDSIESEPEPHGPYEQYGYIGDRYQTRGEQEAALERLRQEVSPRLQTDPEAILNPREELDWYRSELERREGTDYVESIDREIESAPELVSGISSETRSIVTIPVKANGEQDGIYNTLSLYARQNGNANQSNVVLLLTNWTEADMADPAKRANVQKTKDEIERAKRDFPDLRAASVEHQFRDDEARDGRITSLIAKRKNNLALMAVQRAMREGKLPDGQDILVIHNDADANGLNRSYIENMQKAMAENPETDVLTGVTLFGLEENQRLPGFGFVMNAMQGVNMISQREGNIHTAGANFGFRASTYAAAGGLGWDDRRGAGSDDLAVGYRISDIRNSSVTNRGGSYLTTGGRAGGRRTVEQIIGAELDTNSDRYLHRYLDLDKKGLDIGSAYATYSTEGRNDTVTDADRAVVEDFEGSRGFDEIVERVERNLSVIYRWSGHGVARAGFGMFLPPGGWKVRGSGKNTQIELTRAGHKYLRDRLRGEPGEGSYGERHIRNFYRGWDGRSGARHESVMVGRGNL